MMVRFKSRWLRQSPVPISPTLYAILLPLTPISCHNCFLLKLFHFSGHSERATCIAAFNNNDTSLLQMILKIGVVVDFIDFHTSHNSASVNSNFTSKYLPSKLSTLPHKPSNDIIVLTGDGTSSLQMVGH